MDDNDIESEEENLTRTSNSSPIPTIDQLSPDKEYLGEDNEEEEDSDDLDADLQTVNSIASSASHRRFLLTGLISTPCVYETDRLDFFFSSYVVEINANFKIIHFRKSA